ncbi:acyl-coenzyme A thioesterase 4-like isoform X2 [Callorhinchus milii]|uniref:Uncharacterized protein n=3 Tax=Callorhinchus milii TaxID=7868 RepID=A0A4W3JFP4_CALMI|nr:acyl-coenzyme A thioesterase 4-like isoform X2 [Callorhinchus milii]XP_007907333.1 acyl-coenzyme A thioesterase 4-like isoform X2 [Callorhinchus milii]XP_042190712.1 acyl-coenzyme A thioesterase 4-like isoform X2 [Callorhinchus milii]|eukprot:gi/632980969/ref/XP_007907331.1/ PREDICTED: acyl-coenzyme A thioesterase 4-like isoform X2 [Callorhinchus milii]
MKGFGISKLVRLINASQSKSRLVFSFERQLSLGIMSRRRLYSVAPIIKVEPTRGLMDELMKMEVSHLVPNQPVTLHSRLESDDSFFWEAYAHYVSDAEGTVKVTRDVSVGGTYTGREPMGLIWSMTAAPGTQHGMRLRKIDVTKPYLVNISLYDGHLSHGFEAKAELASVVVERSYIAPGVTRSELEGQVVGTLFLPPGPGPFPAVLDMWGGGGGLVEYRASLLASRGFVTLALVYMAHKDLPEKKQSFSLNPKYFEDAFNTLNNHPKVARGHVAILGLSYGVSLALYMATEIKNINPSCLVCISGSHVLLNKKESEDMFGNFLIKKDRIKLADSGAMIWRNIALPITDNPEHVVEVAKIRCPLMLIVGEDDQNWPVPEATVEITKLMKTAKNAHLLTVLSYPGAGHLIEPPYSPHCRESKFKINSTQQRVILLWGGDTKAHSYAQEDSWRKILAYLEKHTVLRHQTSAAQCKL